MDVRPNRARDRPTLMTSRAWSMRTMLPPDLLGPDEDLEPEGDRLGVDAVGPADEIVCWAHGLPAEDAPELDEAFPDPVERLDDEEGEGPVDDVVRRQPEVDVAAVLADVLPDRRKEGDDVVLLDLFDFLDAFDVRRRPGRSSARGRIFPSLAQASQTAITTTSHRRYLFCSVQTAPFRDWCVFRSWVWIPSREAAKSYRQTRAQSNAAGSDRGRKRGALLKDLKEFVWNLV